MNIFEKTNFIAELAKLASAEKCEIAINIDPDRTEVSIQPWEKYEVQCPYGKEK